MKPQRLNKYLFNNNTPILDMYHDAIMQTANLSTFANCISDTSFILQVSFGDSILGTPDNIGKVKIFLRYKTFSLEVGLGQANGARRGYRILDCRSGQTPISTEMLKTQKQKKTKSFTYVDTACGTYYIYGRE